MIQYYYAHTFTFLLQRRELGTFLRRTQARCHVSVSCCAESFVRLRQGPCCFIILKLDMKCAERWPHNSTELSFVYPSWMIGLIICTSHEYAIYVYPSDQSRTRWERGAVHRGFRWGNVRVRDNLEDLDVGGRITLEWILKESVGRVRTGLTWLSIGVSVGLLWTR